MTFMLKKKIAEIANRFMQNPRFSCSFGLKFLKIVMEKQAFFVNRFHVCPNI